MTSYNTIEQFKKRAIPSKAFDQMDSDTIQFYLTSAKEYIDSHLLVGNELPLFDEADLAQIQYCEIIIASYRLHLQRGVRPSGDGTIDNFYQLYVDVVHPEHGILAQIRNRTLLLKKDSSKDNRLMNLKLFGKKNKTGFVRKTKQGVRYL